MNTTEGDPPAQDAAFFELLIESGLVSAEELATVGATQPDSGLLLDEILVARGVIAADALLKVVSRAWHLPPIHLARTRVDKELVHHWPGQRYLAENWMPVRDQANGTVLVATARIPDPERAAHIASVLQNPVEFVAATSSDIRTAVLRAFVPEGNRAVLAGLRILRRDRDRSALVR
ncbi:hypothetical protein [Glaciihabitans sp. UYNi722]|uniref:GspE/PulE/PilB domain-containing protein n=1 Tax=Glaciihabitans sp. UYNi722 TaxID=3156344 RepID=UPI003397CE67